MIFFYLKIDQKERRIEKLPNILSYMSYIYFFSGALIGPSFDFIEYRDFIHKRKIYSNIPSSVFQSLKSFLKSCVFMVVLVLFASKFPLEYCGTDDFGNQSLLYRFYFLNLSISFARCRYYSGWLMGQAGVDASGLSFGGNRNDGTSIWDNILTADPGLELLSSPKDKIDVFILGLEFF